MADGPLSTVSLTYVPSTIVENSWLPYVLGSRMRPNPSMLSSDRMHDDRLAEKDGKEQDT